MTFISGENVAKNIIVYESQEIFKLQENFKIFHTKLKLNSKVFG